MKTWQVWVITAVVIVVLASLPSMCDLLVDYLLS